MRWKQKKKDPEPFSWQTLSDKEKATIISYFKDEIRQRLDDNNQFEQILSNLYWESIQNDDDIHFHYHVEVSLSMLRAMIRVMKPKKTKPTSKKTSTKKK